MLIEEEINLREPLKPACTLRVAPGAFPGARYFHHILETDPTTP